MQSAAADCFILSGNLAQGSAVSGTTGLSMAAMSPYHFSDCGAVASDSRCVSHCQRQGVVTLTWYGGDRSRPGAESGYAAVAIWKREE